MEIVKQKRDTLRPTIRISDYAFGIIEEDRFNFCNGELTFAAFCNVIFKNFHTKAKCNFQTQHDKTKSDLKNALTTLIETRKVDDSYRKTPNYVKIIEDFIYQYADANTYKSYDKLVNKKQSVVRKSVKIYLTSDNSTEIEDVQSNDSYFPESSFQRDYLSALFEEYADLPAYERERIFFNESRIEVFKKAKENRKKLKIIKTRYSKSKQDYVQEAFHFIPYDILQDPTRNYNYLVGISKRVSPEKGEARPASFRLSHIQSMSTLEGDEFVMTQTKKNAIEQNLRRYGVQYLAAKPRTENDADSNDKIPPVIVRFTKKGDENLKKWQYMRPPYKRTPVNQFDRNNETYTEYEFECSDLQAFNYFFKFGKNAYIVQPTSLRDKFIRFYKEDYESYIEQQKLDTPIEQQELDTPTE